MGAHLVGQQEVLVQGPDEPQQTLHNTLDLPLQQVTNFLRYQAKTVDGHLRSPQRAASSHYQPVLLPRASNGSGLSASNSSPDRACSPLAVTMALYLPYKCTPAGRGGASLLLPAVTSFHYTLPIFEVYAPLIQT